MSEKKAIDPLLIQNHNDQKNRYEKLSAHYNNTPQGLHFISKHTQYCRFLQFLKIGSLEKKSLLDLGCGLGDFLQFLTDQGITTEYTGYDIVPAFIEQCQKKFPQAHFEERDIIFAKPKRKFDYVIASGIFAHANTKFFEELIKVAFDVCNRCFAFNMFETDQDDFFKISQEIVLFHCRKLSPKNLTLFTDYLPHDYTVILHK